MRAVIQRVHEAKVRVLDQVVGAVGVGYLILLGVSKDDLTQDVSYLAQRILSLRLFPREDQDFSLDIREIQGEILVVSQFTLYGSTDKGRRPNFGEAAKAEAAQSLYQSFVDELRQSGLRIATGTFGAHMDVALTNNGPVTLILDSH